MKLLFLTEPEVDGIRVRWSDDQPKSQHLVNAARAAGFTSREIQESPLGILEEDFVISATEIAKAGAVVLGGTNGSMLIEYAGRPRVS
jgi:hypothetical protein